MEYHYQYFMMVYKFHRLLPTDERAEYARTFLTNLMTKPGCPPHITKRLATIVNKALNHATAAV